MTTASSTDVVIIGAGQAGLATAHALQSRGRSFVVLEASDRAAGSWPRYYDSLVLFSPARFSALPGRPFAGAPDRYPKRDEVVEYLTGYAEQFRFPIRYLTRVGSIERDGDDFVVHSRDAAGSRTDRCRAVVAATGSFSHPNLPTLPGQATFGGETLHALAYREPSRFAGKRVVVVGAGNTAVQIAVELAAVARVTLATRERIRYLPQRILGKDIHWWFHYTKIDRTRLFSDQSTPVLDDGTYRRLLRAGTPEHRPMFHGFDDAGVVWADGTRAPVDTVIFGTGYRPAAEYLAPLGGVDADALVLQRGGVSTVVPGLYFVGYSKQRNFASATLRGVGPDAAVVGKRVEAFLRG